MRKTIRKVIAIMGILGLIASLFGCAGKGEDNLETSYDGYHVDGSEGAGDDAVVNTSGVTGFCYSYDGSVGGNSYSYRIESEGDVVTFTCEMQMSDYGEMSCSVEPEILEQLNDIYLEHNIARWDGFNKVATEVLDGDGFFVSFDFEDGGYMSAYGTNAYPEGYGDFCTAIEELFEPLKEQLAAGAKQEIIDKGVQGNLDFIMAEFKQQGASGDDEYNFYITSSENRENNFNVTIKSLSGDFIEEGRYRYYCTLPDEAIDFGAIQSLIEKYDVIQWYGWDKVADDYNNCEWFQVDFGFEEGSIDACGTEHPENYDEFRTEFLQTMIEIIKNAEENYGLEQYEK